MKNLAVCYWISKVVDYKWNTRVYVTPSFMSRVHKKCLPKTKYGRKIFLTNTENTGT